MSHRRRRRVRRLSTIPHDAALQAPVAGLVAQRSKARVWETSLIIPATAAGTLGLSILKRILASPERKLDYRLYELALNDPTLERCMAHLLGPPLVGGNRITSLTNGDEIFQAMLAAIREAYD